ncbi:4'-phosphopantetheinyl transferase superfamily protein [Pedobacter sp. PF22-3]|uniref:4'-phosphopantetheinyl transferase family protein n=1 Tax=Pedobacter sp. PF22-3 TaxID=2994467 RepID=UPI0022476505|nr:4'-phosphopantetheinyl transferase superfamily protein [Pedobacter sp. PF22-3]MCX2492853.1 4'-phosphopantetheinyl transferase superfamily protein [Pedobacter sp. PF22-3]
MITLLYSYIEKDLHQKLLKDTLNNFPDDFQYKISQFRRWQDAQLSLLGRLLLLRGLSKFNIGTKDIRFVFNAHNKPYLENTALNFNISHSEDLVVCAFSTEGEIGVDVELIRNIDVSDFKSQMTLWEWNKIHEATDKTEEFFTYWTQKEATLKACGEGLTGIDLTSFHIVNNKAIIKKQQYLLHEVDISPRYKCHIAIKSWDHIIKDAEVSLCFLSSNTFCSI